MKELQRKILQLSSEEGDINTNWVVSDSYLEDTLADVDRRNFEQEGLAGESPSWRAEKRKRNR